MVPSVPLASTPPLTTPVLGMLGLEEIGHVRRDGVVEAQPRPLLHEERVGLSCPEGGVVPEFRTDPQVAGNGELADVEQLALGRIEFVIWKQIRNRARHGRHRRVFPRGRCGFLGHNRSRRDPCEQDRGQRPFDTVVKSFHCDSSCKLIPPAGSAFFLPAHYYDFFLLFTFFLAYEIRPYILLQKNFRKRHFPFLRDFPPLFN